MIIAGIMFVSVIVDAVLFVSIPAITFAWILVGIIIGYPFGRLTKISWNSDKSQLALVGSQVIIQVIFIVTRIITSMIIRTEFAYLTYVLDIVLLISVGSSVGRTMGTLKQIRLAMASSATSGGKNNNTSSPAKN